MVASEVQYRAARSEDAEAVHALIQPFVAESLLLERTLEEVRDLTPLAVCAEHEQQVVGFAAVEVYSKKLAEIQCLAVHADYQALGVGRRIVTRCVELAREQGVLELMVITSSDRFLMQCGFHYSLPGQKRALFINP